MKQLRLPSVMGCCCALIGWPMLAQAQQFSASVVDWDGDTESRIARIYRSDERWRIEHRGAAGEIPLVEIRAPDLGLTSIVWPDRGEYLTERNPHPGWEAQPPDVAARCQRDPAWRCEQRALFPDADRRVELWQVSRYSAEGWQVSLFWQDAETGSPLRQQWPDGSSLQLIEEDQARHQGRPVTRRHYLGVGPDGTRWHHRQWFDPQLSTLVREDFADGTSRWLADLVLEAQPKELFQPPAGYQAVDRDGAWPEPAGPWPSEARGGWPAAIEDQSQQWGER